MKISKLALVSFLGAVVCFGGAAYKFSTTGVTMSPLVFLGLGACLISCGVIALAERGKDKKKQRK